MDPTAAAANTETALRSALNAANREREALAQRLDEVDQLIDDLSQAAEGSGEAPTRQAGSVQRTGRKGTAKAAAKKGTKRGAKKGAAKGAAKGAKKSAKRAQRKAATKGAAKRATSTTTARRRTSGGEGMGRTDRVVQLIAGASQPVSTGEVRTQLSDYEPGVTSKLVSASLSYAERKGRIRRTDDGRWVAVTSSSGSSSSS